MCLCAVGRKERTSERTSAVMKRLKWANKSTQQQQQLKQKEEKIKTIIRNHYVFEERERKIRLKYLSFKTVA
jgi:hypothetical protein